MNCNPLVTVIMPIRNEAAYIERTLSAILIQDYPHDRLEIIIADGMSVDGTRAMIAELTQKYVDHRIHLIDNPQGIFSTGFNAGLRRAQGDIIIMMGGHTIIDADYIGNCVEQLRRHPDFDCVGGYIHTVAQTPVSQTIALAMSSVFGVGGVAFRTKPNQVMEVDTVAFAAYRKSAIERCGLLDEELVRNQDDEYNYRLRKLGGRILLSSAIQAKYYSRGTLRKLWSQYYQYGYWKVRVLQKHPAQMQWRQFVPPLFVAALLGGALPALFNRLIAILWSTMLVLYVLANLTAAVWTAAHQGWRHLLLLPVVFATLHISYGLGFLVGLIRFAHRWRAAVQAVAPVQPS